MQDKNFYLLEDQVDQVSHCHPSDQQDPTEQCKKCSVDHATRYFKITDTEAKEKNKKYRGELLTLDPLEPLGPWGPYGQEHLTQVGVYCAQLGAGLNRRAGWNYLQVIQEDQGVPVDQQDQKFPKKE